jgi:hypothetical protein
MAGSSSKLRLPQDRLGQSQACLMSELRCDSSASVSDKYKREDLRADTSMLIARRKDLMRRFVATK